MKKIEFKTGKCEFDLLEGGQDYTLEYMKNTDWWQAIHLANITEEEASGIVDSTRKNIREKDIIFQDYQSKYKKDFSYDTAIESLHSLLKSKGIHLFENPIKLPHSLEYCCSRWTYYGYEVSEYRKAEEKTFYNPMIFIKIK